MQILFTHTMPTCDTGVPYYHPAVFQALTHTLSNTALMLPVATDEPCANVTCNSEHCDEYALTDSQLERMESPLDVSPMDPVVTYIINA